MQCYLNIESKHDLYLYEYLNLLINLMLFKIKMFHLKINEMTLIKLHIGK